VGAVASEELSLSGNSKFDLKDQGLVQKHINRVAGRQRFFLYYFQGFEYKKIKSVSNWRHSPLLLSPESSRKIMLIARILRGDRGNGWGLLNGVL
jgi:hypothetical protein